MEVDDKKLFISWIVEQTLDKSSFVSAVHIRFDLSHWLRGSQLKI